ncbi:DnaJ, subfamily C [Hirsutella rhossiliensis]|uniref:DnaJ, subfamily C n=1 Tax=Hirsutella rhossiliensis TaxID=111463 RepID=A0A9P8SG31_9HYPO|nr:DnaJ, subfamily C [Hirsutella rhossiliensis]KAH0960709.1 DnaJ, subfamily C [Hirsutella rhossiliensis]
MARRLEEATEDALLSGGASGRRAVEDAGFSDELKKKLLEKIADAQFKGQNADAGLPPAAGQGTRHTAAAQPWTGSETTEDSVLRMLDDAHKPLKPGARGKYQPPPVDMRLKRGPAQSPGQRAVSARDQASMYASMGIKGSKGLSDEERDELKREFRERFQPGARSIRVSVSGLAALANERIENAIARGQFKDLPRGKGVERDPRVDNPFIDTTEYILNKMIQRQDIVPPWIEKQQELVKASRVFRQRLRNDWKRHAARMIAASGGSLQEQMKRADEYAAAERMHNPRQRGAEHTAVPTNSTDHAVTVKLRQKTHGPAETQQAQPGGASPPPFRDADWEQTESAYMKLSIENLNNITRSYNLMAPELARKPYFSLQRELAACFADVAPLLAGEIRQRATGRAMAPRPGAAAAREGRGIMGHLGHRNSVNVHLEAEDKAYGFREWWADFWKRRWRG